MNLLLKFPDQSKSFTHGVEFGRLLEKMERGDDPIKNNNFPIHDENKELITDSCQVYGYVPVFGESKDGWVEFIGVKKVASEN